MIERLARCAMERAIAIADALSVWLQRREQRRGLPPPSTLTLRDLLEIKKESDSYARRTQAPTVVIPAPSERKERGGRGPRY